MLPERSLYDWTFRYPHALAMGRLKVFYRDNLLPGDGLSCNTSFFVRLRDFRFFQLTPIRFDVFWFWEPLRDYYAGKNITVSGGKWQEFLLDQGRSGASSLGSYLFDAPSGDDHYAYLQWLGGRMRHDVPWVYDRFYEHFIRPVDENSDKLFDRPNAPYVKLYPLTGRDAETSTSTTPALPSDDYTREYGRKVPKPPGLLGPNSLRRVPLGVDPVASLTVDSGSVQVNLSDLGFAGNQALRQANQQTYNRRASVSSFLNSVYGVGPRDISHAYPILLAHETVHSDIFDVIGTAGDEHGRKISVGAGTFQVGFPEVFIPEHGNLIGAICMRPETFYPDQISTQDSEFGYGELLADPIVFGQGENLKTKGQVNGKVRSSEASDPIGYLPHHQEWRDKQNMMDPIFDLDKDNIFGLESQHGGDWAGYVDSDTPNLYNGWFREPKRYGHAIVVSTTHHAAWRIIPDATQSIMQDIQLRGGTSRAVGGR